MSFQNLDLSERIVHGIQSMRYIDPTPIQEKAFPIIMGGKDLIASAQTGTGKTAAFGLPLLSKMEKHGELRTLILEPTRELAAQVESAFNDFSSFTDLRIASLYGGVGYGKQREQIKRGVDTVVATPGRLLDFLQEKMLSLKNIQYLVLDEVDRMLDMGFLPDVKKIVQHCPKERQTLLFSATLPPQIESLCTWVLREPEILEIGERRSPAETVTHAFYPVAVSQKFDLLLALLEKTEYKSVLIFCRTKRGADSISHRLETSGHKVAVLHSDRSQTERFSALEGFKSGELEVMVATDIAARGIDVAGVTHVINYDVPQHPEDYVHRIGRTGRAQAEGDAFTLITAEEMDHVKAIERFIGAEVPRMKLEGFSYVFSMLLSDRPATPSRKRRRR